MVHELYSASASLPPLRQVFPNFDQENLRALTNPEMNKLNPNFARCAPLPQLSRTPSLILLHPVFSRPAGSTPSLCIDNFDLSNPPMDSYYDEGEDDSRSDASSSSRAPVPRCPHGHGHGSGPATRRAARPTYTEEEKHFVWYYRCDLALDWAEVNAAYSAQFPERPVQGLQSMVYRMIDDHNLPQTRRRSRACSPAQDGLHRTLPEIWYPWMRTGPFSSSSSSSSAAIG